MKIEDIDDLFVTTKIKLKILETILNHQSYQNYLIKHLLQKYYVTHRLEKLVTLPDIFRLTLELKPSHINKSAICRSIFNYAEQRFSAQMYKSILDGAGDYKC